MKKIITACVLMLCVLFTSCAKVSDNEPITKTEQALFSFGFADVKKGTELLMANTEYHNNLTKADLEYRLQKKDATLEEYREFAKDSVREFSKEEKDAITMSMQQIEDIMVKQGYSLPKLNNITFVKTTMYEEGEAAAYTHNTEIYLGEHIMKEFLVAPDEEKIYFTATFLHELFHCLTRNNPDFRKDMYSVIGFSIGEKNFEIPESVKNRIISNPDVDRHDSYATFTINGEKKDCFVVLLTSKDFENKGDRFFDYAAAHLIAVDNPDEVYTVEDTEDFWDVFGKNTSYVIDPEECLADNFAYAFLSDEVGFNDIEWPNPEILEKISELLKAEAK